MVKTGNEYQHTDYMSSRGKNCKGSLLRGSVVPAKFLLVLLNTLLVEDETSNALVVEWVGNGSTLRITGCYTAQTERILMRLVDTSSLDSPSASFREEWQSNWGQCTLSGRRNAAFTESEPCAEHGNNHSIATDGASVFPVSRRQPDISTDGDMDSYRPRRLSWLQEYALLDSGSGLTSCPINYANDIPMSPRLANLSILSNATGGSVEGIGLRQVRVSP